MNKLAIKMILWYQKHISPNRPKRCRHTPTCSNYALVCYQRFNFFKASFLTAKRILTCNPLFKPKYDPVPEKKIKLKKIKKE
ncbi:MAG: membrane protein insertion efficiency factor YidD [Acholeplasmatales bacterium]|jgi:putative membrane protein insertion efficiency factor|nr:membrane protein insertion efficiency factor YidD [Acholeplasmataceae bacterium]MCK9289508.1 membrane protein insertion efficiency factor YidD [Acholeplasmataceae bacterium]MDY0114927.1 membrane protein insertion efficiency factor YidD [Acholeplasmatales bacterium]HHT39936.1 membrane protein insertion efficiency factor YidD [Acholeplasmataceae bacterium]